MLKRLTKEVIITLRLKFTLSKKNLYIIISAILFTAAICVVDYIVQPGYWVKSGIKIALFLVITVLFFVFNKDERKRLVGLFVPKWRDLLIALGVGAIIYGAIVGAYFLLRGSFDFSGITGKLTADTGVSKENFIFVALYISVINSLLEELMFRGLSFIILKKSTTRLFAYGFSSLLFAVYHSGMTSGYFNVGVFLLTLFALFVGGVIFNALNEKSETIYASWLAHMCANLGINTVGLILFGII